MFPSFSCNFNGQLSPNIHRLVILCICWDIPSENTGLWQLQNVFRAFKGQSILYFLQSFHSFNSYIITVVAIQWMKRMFMPEEYEPTVLLLRFLRHHSRETTGRQSHEGVVGSQQLCARAVISREQYSLLAASKDDEPPNYYYNKDEGWWMMVMRATYQ